MADNRNDEQVIAINFDTALIVQGLDHDYNITKFELKDKKPAGKNVCPF